MEGSRVDSAFGRLAPLADLSGKNFKSKSESGSHHAVTASTGAQRGTPASLTPERPVLDKAGRRPGG